MFETTHLHTRVSEDGNVRVVLPSGLPPESEVDVMISFRPRLTFATREEWEAHVDRIAGSIPDLEAPERRPAIEIEPL